MTTKTTLTLEQFLGADVAVHERAKVEPITSPGFQKVAPLLAVEVISPSNDAADIELKVKQYLKAGSGEVWLLYPVTRYPSSFCARDPGSQDFRRARNLR